jgi:hypothetical protein
MKQLYRITFLALLFCVGVKYARAAGHTVSITVNNTILCFGSNTGSVTANVSGGVGPFTYAWTPSGGNSATATGLSAGNYQVTVTDQSDMSTATATITITSPPQLTINFFMAPAFCNTASGQLTANVSGGTPVYTYWWSPSGQTTATIVNMPPGTFTVIVTDANGCTLTQTFTIMNIPGPSISTITVSPPNVCSGQSATLTPTFSGGSGPYTYNWTNPGFTLSNPNILSPVATPTSTVGYTFTVTDANGCQDADVALVNVTPALNANVVTVDATCNVSNGSATASVISGTPPYQYQWSTGDTIAALNNISAGQYTLTVTDASGCQDVVVSGVSNVGGPAVTMVANPTGCTNYSNGMAAAVVSGIPPFTYSWNTIPTQTTDTISGLPNGEYFVTVTDSAGCVTVDSVTVNATAGNLYMYISSVTPSNCLTPTGSATTNVQGGNPPYNYSWSNGGTSGSISNLLSGYYSVTVTDQQGCTQGGSTFISNVCANVIRGRVYVDMNGDSVFGSGDIPLVGTMVYTIPYNSITTTDANGEYISLNYTSGAFSVHTNVNGNYNEVVPASGIHTANFVTIGDSVTGLDFIYNALSPFQDLRLSLTSGVARPGFTQVYNITCTNVGITTESDTIFFRHDSILSLFSAIPPFDGYNYPDGYWLYNNFGPSQTIVKTIYMQVPTIPNGGYIGRQLVANARIEPLSSDSTSWDNGDDEVDIITGSYDPNLKECWSPTMNEFGDIWPNDLELDYTIHFQNSGTDTAFTVVVVDTLPQELDITTFRMGASSHPCTYNVTGYNDTNVVTFTFMNILLPDSNINEPASHGFASFTIDRYPNLPIGTQILNEANNYFDFNPAVVTNTDTVTITIPLSISESIVGNVIVYPNPAQDNVNILLGNEFSTSSTTVTLRDISGRAIITSPSYGSTLITLNTDACSAGMYFITIESENHEIITRQLIISEK